MSPRNSYVLITGGAGFIGTNLAQRLADQGKSVLVYDNLSRPGVEENLQWLLQHYPSQVSVLREDIRNERCVYEAVAEAEAVFHLAAQVAVTSSLSDPIHDFEVNARGTLNVLEGIRKAGTRPFLLYTSTNKVLGGMEDLALIEAKNRYIPADENLRRYGIGEDRGIEFCSPYGCSKGAADQYVLDYARCFRMPSTVFRMSCIYGPHQCGNEDQGWVAHFVKQAIAGSPITFYGDGNQVRDALNARDLVDAFLLAWKMQDLTAGRAFNIGGGPEHTTSLVELVDLIGSITGRTPEVKRDDWRPSDQRYYVSDTRKFCKATGWSPKISFEEGVKDLYQWLSRAS